MNQHRQTPHTTGDNINQVDSAFEPWERTRPIPLFVLAVFIALMAWGSLTYISDLVPDRKLESGAVPALVSEKFDAPDPAAPAIVRNGSDTVWSCASCHGSHGQGTGPTPRLAGLSKEYIAKQIGDFNRGTRSNESMRYVATRLNADELESVSQYYSSLPILPPSVTGTADDIARGKALHEFGDWNRNIPACFTCHGKQAEGVGGTFPRLAGQQPEYIFSQLAAWKGGTRHNSAQSLMDDIAKRMDNEDMRAVSLYLGSLK